MLDAANYAARCRLRDGRPIEIRALRPGDRTELLTAINRTSVESLRRRFLAAKREFSEKEIEFFTNVDFKDHVALVALLDNADRTQIVGGGRYVIDGPNSAEVAFVVTDEFQGQGIGTSMLSHLAAIARDAGLKAFTAEVLSDNVAMLQVFKRSGFETSVRRGTGVTHVTLSL
jgi:RimJ/RimL family protein N-acetyltransferase